MRNCLYNKNYNNMKNNSCCGNMQKNKCCNNAMNNQNCNNLNSNSMPNNSGCNNINNNFGCNRPNNSINNNSCRNNADNCNAVEDRNCANRDLMEEMKLDLQATRFSIEELALYLDTHPDDMRAVCMHNQQAKNYRKLSDEYQKVYGPLNIMYPCNSWRWLEEPWPWQTTNNCPMMQNYRAISEETETENDFDLKGGIN